MDSAVCVIGLNILIYAALILIGYLIYKKTKNSIYVTLYVLVLVFILRATVSFTNQLEDVRELNWFERLFDSMVHTLQTFSMDEDYTTYLVAGKKALEEGEYGLWIIAYGVFVSITNFLAPVLGGAMLLDIIAGIFPWLKIMLRPFRHKYVFSELNESSITLAEDICAKDENNKPNYKKLLNQKKFGSRPLIIFTDAYIDKESEASAELLSRAKDINAVCVKRDLKSIRFTKARSVTYLLMDENVSSSISSFSCIMDNKNPNTKKPLWRKPSKKWNVLKKFSLKTTVNKENGITAEIINSSRCKPVLKATDINGNNISGYVRDNADLFVKSFAAVEKKDGKIEIEIKFDFSSHPLDKSSDIKLDHIELLNNDSGESFETLKPKHTDFSTETEFDPPVSTNVYIFVKSEDETGIIRKAYDKSENAPYVMLRVIRDYMNAAINLMEEVPLFLPLFDKEENKNDLNITILGDGIIAEEAFKAIYWCGQIYNVKLHIKVVSKNAKVLEKRLNEFCPEMMECCDPSSPKLDVFKYEPGKTVNPPYIEELDFIRVRDVKMLSSYPDEIIAKTDYYIIALGSDEADHTMTNLLSDKLSKLRVDKNNTEKCPRQCVIVPAIYNTDLSDLLRNTDPDPKKHESYIMPFMSFKDRFSCKNIFMAKFAKKAKITEELYNRSHNTACQEDEYSWWANLAKVVHAPYKLYGFGMLEKKGNDISGGIYKIKEGKTFEDIPEQPQIQTEHRRWNAFLRSQGFSCPTKEEFDSYFEDIGKHKNIPLKLHPCLVESFDEKTADLPDSESFDKTVYDCLDYVSMYVFRAKQEAEGSNEFYGDALRRDEYKQWDGRDYDEGLKALFANKALKE